VQQTKLQATAGLDGSSELPEKRASAASYIHATDVHDRTDGYTVKLSADEQQTPGGRLAPTAPRCGRRPGQPRPRSQ